MSFYCYTCAMKYKGVVTTKEEDPNFECQECKNDLEVDSPHTGHKTIPVLVFIEKGLIPYIDKRYFDAENLLNKMKYVMKAAKVGMAPRLEVLIFIDSKFLSKTKLWIDYHAILTLAERFQEYTDDLDEKKDTREVLLFKDKLTHFGEYVDELNRCLYLENITDSLIINNYRPIFTSNLAVTLPAPSFVSKDNTDFYDLMKALGALNQLENHRIDP